MSKEELSKRGLKHVDNVDFNNRNLFENIDKLKGGSGKSIAGSNIMYL